MHGHTEVIALLQERGAVSREPDIFPDGFLAKFREAAKQPGFAEKLRDVVNRARDARNAPPRGSERTG